jgi:hypothetical protein
MHKYVAAVFPLKKSVAFFRAEPFDASGHLRVLSPFLRTPPTESDRAHYIIRCQKSQTILHDGVRRLAPVTRHPPVTARAGDNGDKSVDNKAGKRSRWG